MKGLLKYLFPFILGFAVGFLVIGKGHRKPSEPQVIRDTVSYTIIDTLVVEKPILRYSYVHDTVRTYFTTIERDTVLVDVPIERKVYEEDSLYRAVISGWHTSLDSLTIFPTETTITITNTILPKPAKWSFGITAGPSVLATSSGRVHAGLGATIGVSYRF